MKCLIVYKSNTGFTRRYAEMLGEKTGGDVKDLKEATPSVMGAYDTVIYGGGLYAGSLNGIKKAKAMFSKSGAKHMIVFAVGAMAADCPILTDTWKRNFTDEELQQIPHFYMVGGLDYSHMKAVHKLMMKVAIGGVKAAKERDEFAETFLETCKDSFDGVDAAYLEPLLQCLQEENL